MAQYEISSWYLHLQRTFSLLGAPIAQNSHSDDMTERAATRARTQHALLKFIETNKVKTLGELIVKGEVIPGTLFTHYSSFYCKGIKNHYPGYSKKKNPDPAYMYSKLDEFEDGLSVGCNFYPEHLTSQSAWEALSGQKRLFFFGCIDEVEGKTIKVQPFCVADLYMISGTGMFNRVHYWQNYMEIRIEDIDEFSKVKESDFRPTGRNLMILKDIPERDIKQALHEIIGEPHQQKDWGGETSDIYSTNVTISGKRLTGSFILKGPARFHKMTMADLGKNGDQIPRAMSEGADLIVLQHCHEIDKFVRTTLKAYATNLSSPVMYLLLDGYETLRVLFAYDKLNVRKLAKD